MTSGAIHLGRHLRAHTLECDVAVVGSGAGGAMVTRELARRGFRVATFEGGAYHRARDFSQREDEMFEALYEDRGVRSTSDLAIRVVQGRGVGGSTVHNTNLCKALPEPLLNDWALPGWSHADLAPYFAEVFHDLGVEPLGAAEENANNAIFRRGVEKLGYQGGYLSHNRQGCVGSGFCEIGCSFDAKLNALRVLIPDAVRHGATIYSDTRIDKIVVERGQVRGLKATLLDERGNPRGNLEVRARAVCLSASATGNPAILERSNIPDPRGAHAASLRLHPGVAVAGIFPDEVRGWMGIPQVYECTEFLSFAKGSKRRVWLLPAFAHPIGTAALMSVSPSVHREFMKLYPRMAMVAAMVHDESKGCARADGQRLRIDYTLGAEDREQLTTGLVEAARILFAAGALRVLVPFARVLELRSPHELGSIHEHGIRALDPPLISVHPHGSLPMGVDPTRFPVDPQGRHRGAKGLYVADGSVFPSSIGVPPQIPIYTFALRIARHLAQDLNG